MASGVLLNAAFAAGSTQAQTQPDAAGSALEEVVVTAERRNQRLQDVPLAISVYTSQARDLLGITSVADMTNFTPGLQYSSQFDRLSLRGIGRTTNSHSSDPSVSVYSDGIYETATIEAGKSPLFLDRVEVLRGPQATLYGRNAIAGAINLVSRRPTEEMYGEIRATYANYEHSILEGAASGPTAIPGVLFRVAVNWERQKKGWYDNIVPGQPDEGNVINTRIAEAQLKFNFNENFEGWTKLTAMRWDNGGGGPGSRSSWNPAPYATYQGGNTSIDPGYGCSGRVTGVVNLSPTGCVNPAANDPRKIASLVPFKISLKDTWIFASEWTWHAPTFDTKYTSGGTRYHYGAQRPTDTNAAPISQFRLPGGLLINPQEIYRYEEKEKWWSHELTFSSTKAGPVQWLAGLYYWNEHYTQPFSVSLPGQPQLAAPLNASCPRTSGVCAPNPGLLKADDRSAFHIQSKAAYAQVDWTFAPKFKATVGLRYADDSKSGSEEGRVLCFAYFACTPDPRVPGGFLTPEISGAATPAVDLTQISFFPPVATLPRGVTSNYTYDPATGRARRTYSGSWEATTGNIGVQWEPDPDTNLYVRYSRGYKAGGFRTGFDTVLATNPYTKPEHLDDIEVGLKARVGQTLQANIAVFRYDYKNAQIPLSVTTTTGNVTRGDAVFYNVPKSVAQGIEIESIWQPTAHLEIFANYAYLDAHISRALGPVDPADPAALDPQATPLLTLAQCAATRCPVDQFTALTGGGFQRGQDLKGQKLPNAPKHKIAVDVNYTWNLAAGSLTGGVNYTWRAAQYGSIFNRSYTRSPSWDQWDARLIYKPAGRDFTVIVYGKNLANTVGYQGGATAARKAGFIGPATPGFTETPVTQGITTSYPISPPRTYGVELQYRFY